MQITEDLLKAKQTLSSRLLRAGLRNGVVLRGRALSVREAISSAAHNVHSVGIGFKVVDGKVTDQPCVSVFVIQKLANSLLPPRDQLPKSIDGIPTDVVESPPSFLLRKASTKKRVAKANARETVAALPCTDLRRMQQRPLIGGISAAHFNVTAGTIAYFCRSTQFGDDPNKVYVLSNNHVFADVNNSQPGDNLFQPGPQDGGTNQHHIAELQRFVSLDLNGTEVNRVDAAIGELLPGVEFSLTICKIGKLRGTGLALVNMKVCKHGRTTGYTEGNITHLAYDTLIRMSHTDSSLVAKFDNQIRIERAANFTTFGLGGDSGSMIVDKARTEAVGLYFAGPDSGEYGVACHINDVLTELEIELL